MNEPSIMECLDVTRVEVIDQHGRAYTAYEVSNVKISFQDNNKTLKIFLKNKEET